MYAIFQRTDIYKTLERMVVGLDDMEAVAHFLSNRADYYPDSPRYLSTKLVRVTDYRPLGIDTLSTWFRLVNGTYPGNIKAYRIWQDTVFDLLEWENVIDSEYGSDDMVRVQLLAKLRGNDNTMRRTLYIPMYEPSLETFTLFK